MVYQWQLLKTEGAGCSYVCCIHRVVAMVPMIYTMTQHNHYRNEHLITQNKLFHVKETPQETQVIKFWHYLNLELLLCVISGESI